MTDSFMWPDERLGYQGDNIDLLTLSGDNPDAVWIAQILARRADSVHCICGCNRPYGDKSVLNPKCVKPFKKRLDILSPVKAEQWSKWLDKGQPVDTEEPEEWSRVLDDLCELQTDLWCAENRTAIMQVLARTTHRLEHSRQNNYVDDANRLNRALDPSGPIGSWHKES